MRLSNIFNSHDTDEQNITIEKIELPDDIEKKTLPNITYAGSHSDDISKEGGSVIEKEDNSFWFRFTSKLNAETNGIEPISDDEKTETSTSNAAIMWFSANLVLSAFTLGALGPAVFKLNFGASALTIIFFNLLGIVPVAYFSLFGAKTGMRQMILSRYMSGYLTGRFFAFMNCIACIGWCVLNTICSAQLLNMVNQYGHRCPLWAACLLIVGCTVVISFMGLKFIHAYEKWSWVPNMAIFFVIIARLSRSGKWSNGEWTSGPTTAGNVLSFGCSIFGFAGAWATYASDFTVYMPRNFNQTKTFINLFLGLTIALYFSMMLGAASAMGVVNDPTWAGYYESNSIGGLIYCILVPKSLHGFGEFCCVLFAMSTVANNIPNMYAVGLSAQAIWDPLSKVPRSLWTLLGNGITLGIAIPACYYFETFLQDFMNGIAYYSAIYISICCTEHFVFRKGKIESYDPEIWNDATKLPIGIAGLSAFIVGAFGVALGMCQTYWMGEIGRLIGQDGGDIGLELGASWAFITYVAVRPFELRYIGR